LSSGERRRRRREEGERETRKRTPAKGMSEAECEDVSPVRRSSEAAEDAVSLSVHEDDELQSNARQRKCR
jgi:hypothetical protein